MSKQLSPCAESLLLLGALAAYFPVTSSYATSIDIPASISGDVMHNYVLNSYTKSYGDLKYTAYWPHGYVVELNRAFVEFDLDALPETCKFLSVELHYYQYSHWNGQPAFSITLIPSPGSLDAQSLFDAIGGGRWLHPYDTTNDGWMAWPLAPMSVFDSCGRAGRISCGTNLPESEGDPSGYACGCDSTNKPYLHIEYVLPNEPDIQALRAELATYPLVVRRSDTALLELTNKGIGISDPFWVCASLGLTRESTRVEPIAVGETSSVRVPLPSPSAPDVMNNYQVWAADGGDSRRYDDSTQLPCWSFPTSTYAAEGFDESGFPPWGWSVHDFDGGNHCWARQSDSGESHSGTGFASCPDESTGTTDDWLVSGPVYPSEDYSDSVGFFARSVTGFGRDTLEVLALSGTCAPVSLLTLDVRDTVFSRHSISLDTYDGDTVQVVFRHRTWGRGNGIYLDDIWFSRIHVPETIVAGHIRVPPRDMVQSSNVQLPRLAFAPNPAKGGLVAVRCSLAVGRRRRMTLSDVAGRTVRTFALDPSGITQLNLKALPPGVYLASLEGTIPPPHRKLVLTAR